MAGAVRHVSNGRLIFSERTQDDAEHLTVGYFGATAHVVDLPEVATFQQCQDRRTVIFHMDPVSHVESVAVER